MDSGSMATWRTFCTRGRGPRRISGELDFLKAQTLLAPRSDTAPAVRLPGGEQAMEHLELRAIPVQTISSCHAPKRRDGDGGERRPSRPVAEHGVRRAPLQHRDLRERDPRWFRSILGPPALRRRRTADPGAGRAQQPAAMSMWRTAATEVLLLLVSRAYRNRSSNLTSMGAALTFVRHDGPTMAGRMSS